MSLFLGGFIFLHAVCFERTRGVGEFFVMRLVWEERDREQAASSSLSHPFPFIQLPFLRTPRTKWPRPRRSPNVQGVAFIEGDAEDLPLQTDAFDR